MKAVLIRRFGSPEVMDLEEVDRPIPSMGEVLIRVFCTSVNPVDWKIRNGSLRLISGTKFPMALGFDIAGEVEETGPGVIKFRKGDRVFGMLDFRRRSAYAQYAVAREAALAPVPEGIGFKEAAGVPLAALTAYQALHGKGKIKRGDAVLVNGASGGVGSFAVQIAKAAGASVTAVCGTANVELVRDLGADTVLDYRKRDIMTLADRYDIIFDTVAKLSFLRVMANLKIGGRYITTLPNRPANILSFALTRIAPFLFGRKKALFIGVTPSGPDLDRLGELMRQGRLVPVIDRVYPLNDIREAHAYSETGHARGKIVIQILEESPPKQADIQGR